MTLGRGARRRTGSRGGVGDRSLSSFTGETLQVLSWGALVPTIPLFVASTFFDFHRERDSIRDVVVPRLNAELAPLGCRIELIDLRAGVDQEGLSEVEADLKILDVCAQEIERARPSFVVLVGARGGYKPKSEVVATLLGRHGLEGVDGLSVTEIETVIAARSAQPTGSLFAFLRIDRPEHPDAWRKDQAEAAVFRERIRSNSAFTSVEYQAPLVDKELDLREFETLLEERLRPGMIARSRALATAVDPIRQATALFRETHRPFHEPYLPAAQEALQALDRGNSVCVFGEPGIGASTAWSAVLDLVPSDVDVRAVALRGSGLRVKATDLLRSMLDRPTSSDEIERQIDLDSLLVLGSTGESELGEMRERVHLVRDLARLALEAEPRPLFGLDDVQVALSPADRRATLCAEVRPGHVRWLVSCSDPMVRDELEGEGFVIVEVARLEGASLRHALDASVRFFSPGRQLPAPAVDVLMREPRAATWIEAAARTLLRPTYQVLEGLPDGEGWQEAFDRNLIHLSQELGPHAHDLQMQLARRAAATVGEESFARIVAALRGSYLGLSQDVLAAVAGISTGEVSRTTAMLDPIVRQSPDGRLMVADEALMGDLMADSESRVSSELHAKTAAALETAGLPDTSSRIEYLWQRAASGQDIGPILEQLSHSILPTDGPADIAALDGVLDILGRFVNRDLVITDINEAKAQLLLRLASRALTQEQAEPMIQSLRDAVARSDPGVVASSLAESLDARIAMARFRDERHPRHYAKVNDHLRQLLERSSHSELSDWESADILWATNTLIPLRIRESNLPELTFLLDLMENTGEVLADRTSGDARHRNIFSLAFVRSDLISAVRYSYRDLAEHLVDRQIDALRRLAAERPSDGSVVRMLVDALLTLLGPPSGQHRARIKAALDSLERVEADRRSETQWLKLRGDAMLLLSELERRLSGRATDASLRAAEQAESHFRSLHAALPTSWVEQASLARSLCERLTADPATGDGEAARVSARDAAAEAEGLILASRRTESRDRGIRLAAGILMFDVARVLLDHDAERAIRLLELAREEYFAAARIFDDWDVQARIGATYTVQAEIEFSEAVRTDAESRVAGDLADFFERAIRSASEGLRILDRLGAVAGIGGDLPKLRNRLLVVSAESLITRVERSRTSSRKDLMEASRTLERAAERLIGGDAGQRQREFRPVISGLLARLLAVQVDGRTFGSKQQRHRWERLRHALDGWFAEQR